MNDAVNSASTHPENENKAGIDFLLIEISLGMTFMDVAESYSLPEHQRAAELRARDAYRSALNCLKKLELTDEHRAEILPRLTKLKIRLGDCRHSSLIDPEAV